MSIACSCHDRRSSDDWTETRGCENGSTSESQSCVRKVGEEEVEVGESFVDMGGMNTTDRCETPVENEEMGGNRNGGLWV